ncbi:hypothetical protein L873DRAFT_1797952 [Choiromyces venosus 120613-1]|uniref:Uncharacterized protein n=1 Tax=Choiromyces venosus 120613-1 TaxID=1336337 RepID=A0A3N4K4P7_9PEZI|nr:hypothetical protein L873DRAFT_1797952 [Choiromyces venosus 120613-1]
MLLPLAGLSRLSSFEMFFFLRFSSFFLYYIALPVSAVVHANWIKSLSLAHSSRFD